MTTVPVWVVLAGPAIGAIFTIVGVVITTTHAAQREQRARLYNDRRDAMLEWLALASQIRDHGMRRAIFDQDDFRQRMGDAVTRLHLFASTEVISWADDVLDRANDLHDRGGWPNPDDATVDVIGGVELPGIDISGPKYRGYREFLHSFYMVERLARLDLGVGPQWELTFDARHPKLTSLLTWPERARLRRRERERARRQRVSV